MTVRGLTIMDPKYSITILGNEYLEIIKSSNMSVGIFSGGQAVLENCIA